MKISVIIPSFNDTRVERTVKSILNQKFPRNDYEIILVDGGSDDIKFLKTFDYLNQVCDLVISEPDDGIFDGLNKGIDNAKGDLLFMIGSDDYLIDDNAFEISYSKFKKDSDMIIFELFYVNQTDCIERHWTLPSNLKNIPLYFQIPHFSTFISKTAVSNIRFDLNSYISADFSFFKHIINTNINVTIVNTPICCMTTGGQSSKNLKNIIKGNFQSLHALNYNPYLVSRFILHKLHKKLIHFSLPYLYKSRTNFYQKKINNMLHKFQEIN